jgi:hypothetical protein
MGTVGALAFAGVPLGGLIAGPAVTAAGLRASLAAAALAYCLAGLSPLVFPAWRDMERRAGPSRAAGRVPAEPA